MKNEEYTYVLRKRWGFFGLPFTFTVYRLKEDMVNVKSGFFRVEENDCYMYKVQDVKLTRGLFQRMFGLGNVICYTGDTTTPQILLKNIKDSEEVKEYLLKTSEEARMKRRTMNMLNIGVGDGTMDADGDGLPD